MSYIGNTSTTQAFTPAVDYFSGNGSTTAFTLSRPVASVAQVQVTIDNVAQNPSSAYTVSSNTITFTSAPLSGTNNIYVYYTSPITQVIAPSQGTVQTAQLGNITNIASGNSSLTLQTGSGNTTAITVDTSQNVTAAVSLISPIFKSTGNYTVEYQLIAGGGGGTASVGGGGAGGVTQGGLSVTPTTGYTVTIGAGGAASTNGGNTSLTGATTAIGGGAGAGTGGGTGGGNYDSAAPSARIQPTTAGQGCAGGNGTTGTVAGGGGGGAGSVGGDGSSSSGYGGVGGAGILGLDGVFVAGGGGGGGVNGIAYGGNGGGGNGGRSGSPNSTAGAANTGGGGGGGYATGGAAGGSGKAIIRYFGAQRGTGGTISNIGGWTYHVFTSSGTFTA